MGADSRDARCNLIDLDCLSQTTPVSANCLAIQATLARSSFFGTLGSVWLHHIRCMYACGQFHGSTAEPKLLGTAVSPVFSHECSNWTSSCGPRFHHRWARCHVSCL